MVRRLIVPLILAVLATSVTDAIGQTPFPAPLPNGAVGTVKDPAFPPVRGSVGTPNDPAFPPVNGASARSTAAPRQDSAFPPVNGTTSAKAGAPAAFPSGGAAPMLGGFGAPPPRQAGPPGGEECMKEFVPLREAAEKRGKLIQAAGARHAPPDEACKLIGQYSQAEIKMVKFIDTHSAKCGIPDNVGKQMRTNHKATEAMLRKVCDVAKQAKMRAPAGPSLSEVLGSAGGMPEATTSKKGGSTFDTLSGNVLTR
ncbi:hypothetical protein [Nitrobacter sp. NHB1]|uniref:hypothetical protein n=1 Tax=Nitrobacter sp. NHB1 TaxID=3119830 RepID=UPI003FA5B85D